MKQLIGIIVAGALIAIAILANGYFERKSLQDKIDRCISVYSAYKSYDRDTTEYNGLVLACEKELR